VQREARATAREAARASALAAAAAAAAAPGARAAAAEAAAATAARRAAARARRAEALVSAGMDPRFIDVSDDEEDDGMGTAAAAAAGPTLAAALLRKAAANTASGAASAGQLVPDGYVSYYSSLHGYRIVVPASAVGGVAGEGLLEFREAAGSSDVYRRVLLDVAGDRARVASSGAASASAAAAAVAASSASGVTLGSVSELLLPSPVAAQQLPSHPLSQWLADCESAPDGYGSGGQSALLRPPLRLLEVDPNAYARPSGSSGAAGPPPALNPIGWVTVEQENQPDASGCSAPRACALAASARLLTRPEAWVGSESALVGAVPLGAQLHAELCVRFLAALGVSVRSAVGSSRSTSHALRRCTAAAAERPQPALGRAALSGTLGRSPTSRRHSQGPPRPRPSRVACCTACWLLHWQQGPRLPPPPPPRRFHRPLCASFVQRLSISRRRAGLQQTMRGHVGRTKAPGAQCGRCCR
jgi:hypothetical protein